MASLPYYICVISFYLWIVGITLEIDLERMDHPHQEDEENFTRTPTPIAEVVVSCYLMDGDGERSAAPFMPVANVVIDDGERSAASTIFLVGARTNIFRFILAPKEKNVSGAYLGL